MGTARRLTVLVAALVVLATAVPAVGAAADARVFVKTAIDSDRLAIRPERIALSVHGSLSVHGLHWRGWGGAVAKAVGRARAHACLPDCNLGPTVYPRVRVRLSDLDRCDGHIIYGHLGYALLGPLPAGVERRGVFDMRLTEGGKPVC